LPCTRIGWEEKGGPGESSNGARRKQIKLRKVAGALLSPAINLIQK